MLYFCSFIPFAARPAVFMVARSSPSEGSNTGQIGVKKRSISGQIGAKKRSISGQIGVRKGSISGQIGVKKGSITGQPCRPAHPPCSVSSPPFAFFSQPFSDSVPVRRRRAFVQRVPHDDLIKLTRFPAVRLPAALRSPLDCRILSSRPLRCRQTAVFFPSVSFHRLFSGIYWL